jgi:STE24 endopeptidase
VLAAGWVAAAIALWRSSVPADLSLPEVDASAFFDAAELDRANRYERFLRLNFVLSQLALLVALTLFAVRGHRLMRESAAGRIGTGMLLGMLGLAIVWLAQLPFRFLRLWWQRRYGTSNENYLLVLVGDWLALAGAFLFICLALLIVMALAGALRQRWWVGGAPAFVGLAIVFAFVFPYLLPGLEPLPDRRLAAEARSLAAAQGVADVPVRVEEVSDSTRLANAYAAGIASSRRVVIWDTLLRSPYEDDEVAVVLAHEFAHHARDHLWKGLAWYALLAVPGAFLIAVATRSRGGMYEPRAVPLSLLVLVVLQTVALPFDNVISRRLEAEADWAALQATRDPSAATELFQQFTTSSLADPDPPTWAYVLLESHPTIMQRLAMVEAWRERRG